MNDFLGHYMVPLYFIIGTLAILFLAYKFLSQKALVFRNFGVGLLISGVAFAVWTAVVIIKPNNLEVFTTIGALPFAVGFLFFLMAGTHKLKAANKSLVLLAGVGYLLILLFLRTLVYKSHPAFSSNGLFYFHAEPAIIALYIGAFGAALLPAINVVSQQLKDKTLRFITQFGFTILAVGGIVMLTSFSDTLQTINGWVMGVAFLLLVVAYATKEVK